MKKFMKSYQSKIIALACIASLCLSSCSQDEGTGSNDFGSIGGGGGGTSGSASSGTPLYLNVSTQYDDGDEEQEITYHGTCEIDPTNLAANDITCTLSIPEGMLHFSKTLISVGTNNSVLCPRIEFAPYYRRVSNSATYLPPGETDTVDCSASPIPDECYDGAARDIVNGFPDFTSIWFPTTISSSQDFTVEAAFDEKTYGNTKVCNNLAPASRGMNISQGGYDVLLANTMQDYVLRCMDPWQGLLYRITITIEDYDIDTVPNSPGDNEFYDWN